MPAKFQVKIPSFMYDVMVTSLCCVWISHKKEKFRAADWSTHGAQHHTLLTNIILISSFKTANTMDFNLTPDKFLYWVFFFMFSNQLFFTYC